MHALAQPAIAIPTPAMDRALDRRIARYLKEGAYRAALSLLVPRLSAGAEDLPTLDQAASCYWHLGDAPTALSLMDRIVSGWPDLSSGWTKLATIATSAGHGTRARVAVEEALSRNPKSVRAMALLNRIDPIATESARARRLASLSKAPQVSAPDRALAHHTLGRIAERAGRTPAAFRHYSLANRIHGAPYQPREITAMVAAQLLRFDPEGLPTSQIPGLPRLAFVVGMPRSGTTLLEAILARHDQVQVLGESQALGQTVMAMRRHVAAQDGSATAWDWFGRLSEAETAEFRQMFLTFLPAGSATSDRLLVSKMPLDCFDLGAARVLLPEARFIHMDRHPLDVGLSNFTTVFHDGNGFSRRLDWTGHMIRSVAHSSADYESKLGAAFRRQSYRALVEYPEEEIRAVLTHLGLAWQSQCVSPEQGNYVARTASATQIREAINRRGLGKWEAYRRELAPLVEALGGWDQIAAWEVADRARGPQSSSGHDA